MNDPMDGHKCKKIAEALPCGPGREVWVGELLEPIPGYPSETHCVHVTTPAKSVVFGITTGDAGIVSALMEVVYGQPINPRWLTSMAGSMKHKANQPK
jgi:hypothetical protein